LHSFTYHASYPLRSFLYILNKNTIDFPKSIKGAFLNSLRISTSSYNLSISGISSPFISRLLR
jgi:hypothetical protein